MAERGDIYVLWPQSPRIIVVQAPSTELLLQDLVDTCRGVFEEELDNCDKPYLVENLTGGKQDLQDGSFVGITVVLNDARVAFEARSGPVSQGTATSNSPDGLTLVDTLANFVADGVKPGDSVVNLSDGSTGTVYRVVDPNTLILFDLGGGVENDWDIGDSYLVHPVDVCTIRGGNLTALDAIGDPLLPFVPTYGTVVSVEKATSAALVDSAAPANTGIR